MCPLTREKAFLTFLGVLFFSLFSEPLSTPSLVALHEARVLCTRASCKRNTLGRATRRGYTYVGCAPQKRICIHLMDGLP